MPRPKQRTSTFRKVFTKTPGGKTVTRYKRRKPASAKCAKCKRVLPGVPRNIPSKVRKLPKTARRPERPYGGTLCTRCSREEIKESIRK